MTVLVIAEHDNREIKGATLNTVTAAVELDAGDVEILVAGDQCQAAAESAAAISGISKVYLVDNALYKHGLAEPFAALVVSMADAYSHIVFSHTTHGKNVAPRVAALLDIVQISDIMEVKSPDTFVRPIYAGNAMATVQANEEKLVVTVRGTAFENAELQGSATIDVANAGDDPGLSSFLGQELTRSERPELTSARIVVSGGRGMQSGDNFHLVEAVADRIGAGVGASRAAVDAGYVPNDYQVGQTGKIVAPELYMAIGISGAIQHLAGMKDSKVIVAINKDEEAPIFSVADYGLVGDLFEEMPALAAELDKQDIKPR
ncbi:MAG: electron transfer flavoprotein subunit alpha [Rhodospirillaceae bacterium]|nr:electron transfer flavoprotein subunit alpha [Rhodospirillaceae bacterium]|tara:strand:+ start:2622 stop:3575 length:954 start_codon:yes stop_codon:yes gene_type:complete